MTPSDTSDARDPGPANQAVPPHRGDGQAAGELCPFLVAGDGSWRSAHPSRANLCSAVQPAAPLVAAKQRNLCLLAAHVTCATFGAARALDVPVESSTSSADADLWPESRPTVVALEQVRSGIAGLPAGRVHGGGQALLIGLMVLAFIVLIVARTTAPSSGGGPSTAASLQVPAASASVAPSRVPPTSTPVPTPSPVGSASPAAPTVAPSVSPSSRTPSPSPVPADAQRYKVRSGDTLSSIAARFGVTVKALKRANGITDPSLIRVGRVLIIPRS